MRDDLFAPEAAGAPDGGGTTRCRRGRARFAPGNYRGLGLLAALAILLAALPADLASPTIHPSRRAAGLSRLPIASLAFGPDGRTLATADEAGLVTLWRPDDGWSPGRVIAVRGHARPIAFSPDGGRLGIGGDEPVVTVRDLGHESQDRLLEIPFRQAFDLKISPDGRTMAVTGPDSPEIVLLDLATGRRRMTLRDHSAPPIHLVFAPDGRSLASAAGTVEDRSIRIWDLASARPRARLTGMGSALLTVAYAPDGRLVAGAAPSERVVRVWDVATGEQVLTIAGHSQATRSVAFSPDGRTLATAAGDGAAALWSVATGRELRRLDGRADVLRLIAFSPDGRTLAAAGNDGDLRLWDVDDLIGDRPWR